MQGYSEYKDSGVGWLGDIPSTWEKNKFKFLLREKTKTQNIDLPCGSISFGSVVYKDSEKLTEETRLAYQEVLSGEFLVNPLNLNYDLKSLRTALSGIDVIVSSGYIVLQSNGTAVPEYLKWLLFVFDIRHMKTLGAGIRQTITFKDIGNCVSYLPSEGEQKAIATYLDRETARIDNLIAEKQNFINLLKEKRQALISHVVTKGLDPDVKMKDSGIEWIGEVPEHWAIKRLKHISPNVGVGLVINPSTYTRDEGVYYIFGGDIKEFGFDLSKTRRMAPEDSEKLQASRLSEGDLVSIRVGYPGIAAVVTRELDGANCASVIIIRKGKFNSHWLCIAMNADVGKEQVNLAAYGAAQKQYNVSDAIEFWFPVPHAEEQDKIFRHVYAKLEEFNQLELEILNSIELLKEHRTTLISAAVTGKIDVREQL